LAPRSGWHRPRVIAVSESSGSTIEASWYFPDVIQVFHPQVITMGKSYTMPFYSGVKEGGIVIINSAEPLLSEEDIERLKDLNVALFYIAGTELAIEVAGTELSTNMAMIGAVSRHHQVRLHGILGWRACKSDSERNSSPLVVRPHWTKRSRRNSPRKKCMLAKNLATVKASLRDRQRMGG
jgi:pyruvate ferredoxin oxidoreductase gamma subunit